MSPIRSSLAAGSSHALGDARFAKVVTEVTAQRKEQRWTTSITTPGTNVTLNQTPVAGNVLVVMVSNVNALATPTVTYGGTTATQFTGYFSTGICGYVFYIVLTSGNVAAGGTTLNVTWSAGTAAAVSITEISGVNTANPVDNGWIYVGTYNNTTLPTTTVGHSFIGAIGFMFTTFNGAQTNGGYSSSGYSDWSTSSSWGNHTAAADIFSIAFTKSIGFTAQPSISEILTLATTRNGIVIGISFRPAA